MSSYLVWEVFEMFTQFVWMVYDFTYDVSHCIKGTLEHSTGSPLKTGCHVLQLAGYRVLYSYAGLKSNSTLPPHTLRKIHLFVSIRRMLIRNKTRLSYLWHASCILPEQRNRKKAQNSASSLIYCFIFISSTEKCKAGYFSPTGLAKCFPCASGTYASGLMNTKCTTCPQGTTTILPAAGGREECGSKWVLSMLLLLWNNPIIWGRKPDRSVLVLFEISLNSRFIWLKRLTESMDKKYFPWNMSLRV